MVLLYPDWERSRNGRDEVFLIWTGSAPRRLAEMKREVVVRKTDVVETRQDNSLWPTILESHISKE